MPGATRRSPNGTALRVAHRVTRAVWIVLVAGAAAGMTTIGMAAGAEPRPAGLVLLANLDDDDGDGIADAADDRVNGPADERDLVPLDIRLDDPQMARVRITCGGAPLRFFERRPDGWRHAGFRAARAARPADSEGDTTLRLAVEACGWAGLDGWDGTARIVIEFEDAAGRTLGGERVEARVAPVLLRPATAPATEVFVATGRYDNEPFVAALQAALAAGRLPLKVHQAEDWREMWMQDAFEIGTSSIPGSRMHVVLAGLRDCDRFPDTLLGPDTAVARVAPPRRLEGGDAWADWYGNLEVSPPLASHPHGRALHGRNTRSGESFHPEVVRFLETQGAQDPLWIDTSWLLIKHVDEIVSFLPGPDGRGMLVVPDPEAALRLGGLAPPDTPPAGEPAERSGADLVAVNRRIARIIDEMLDGAGTVPRAGATQADGAGGGLLARLGWNRDRVIGLPVAFRAPAVDGPAAGHEPTDAVPLWSNPVNAVLVNGTVICGAAGMPAPVRQECRRLFLEGGAREVVFLDDGPYHRRGGNVHCATNVRRE